MVIKTLRAAVTLPVAMVNGSSNGTFKGSTLTDWIVVRGIVFPLVSAFYVNAGGGQPRTLLYIGWLVDWCDCAVGRLDAVAGHKLVRLRCWSAWRSMASSM